MYIVTVLDKQMKQINSHYVEEKPTSDVQKDILHRYEDGVYVQSKELLNEDDLVKLRLEELSAQQPVTQPSQGPAEPQPTEGGTI